MEYNLIKSKRKSISITVKDGEVFVRAPKSTSIRKIEAFLVSKEKWIKKHTKAQVENNRKKENFKLDYDSQILLFGNSIRVGDVIGERSDEIKEHVVKFYKAKAKEYITMRTHELAKDMNLKPNNIRITSARTRWGSCSSKGNVNFSWYLIMASEDVIDYVIVHELAHLKEMNHSKRFWNIVGGYVPDWKTRRNELKELQRRLNTEKW